MLWANVDWDPYRHMASSLYNEFKSLKTRDAYTLPASDEEYFCFKPKLETFVRLIYFYIWFIFLYVKRFCLMAPVYLKYADYGIMINPSTAEPPILREISIIDIYVYIYVYIYNIYAYIYNIYACKLYSSHRRTNWNDSPIKWKWNMNDLYVFSTYTIAFDFIELCQVNLLFYVTYVIVSHTDFNNTKYHSQNTKYHSHLANTVCVCKVANLRFR